MRIAIAGGTGTVGRHVVTAAQARGHDVVVVARSRGADVTTGVGLAEALEGIDTVIDVSNVTALSAKAVRSFFASATRHLLDAEVDTGVGHHVALSIVGIDDIDASYYSGKLVQERAVAAGPVPYTIARTAQFLEFVEQVLARMGGPVAVVPKTLMRPVAAREVAQHLVDVAEGGPAGHAADLVGPRDERLADLARRLLAFDGINRRVLELRLPGVFGKGLASGALRGTAPNLQGRITFDEWLRSEDHLSRT